MSTSAGNFSSEAHEYGVHPRLRLGRTYGGATTPSDSRTSRRELSRQLQQLDVSQRSADKKSFLIRRSGSKTRTYIETEERTLDLQKIPIKKIKKPGVIQTEKKRLTEDMPSMRTVTTTKGPYLKRGSFLKTELSSANTEAITVTKKKPQLHLLSDRPKKEMWPEKTTSLYERVHNKFTGAVAPERSAPQIKISVDLDRLAGTKASEASLFGEFSLTNKVPVRKKGILRNFLFEKRRPQQKCHLSMALEDKVKLAANFQREQVEFQKFLIQRTLLMLTKVRGKQLENRIGREKPYNTTLDSPTVSRERFQSPDHQSEEIHLDLDSDQEEDDLIENDYKRFNYVINFKARPTHASAVFTNLDEAIEGHIQFCLTKTEPLYEYPNDYLSTLFRKRQASNLKWMGNGQMLITVNILKQFMPENISKELEIDLIIRDKRAKKFQAVYIEENGKMNNDNFESITLWGFQINKLLTRDLEKDYEEFKVGCSIPIELRKLSTAIIKNLYVGLEEEMDLPNLLKGNNPSSIFKSIGTDFTSPHEAFPNNVAQIEQLIRSSLLVNKQYSLSRFYSAHREDLVLTWEKSLFLGEFSEYYMSYEEDRMTSRSPLGSTTKSKHSRQQLPFVIVHTIEDKSQIDIDSDLKNNSGLPSPINADERTQSFKSSFS